MRGHDFSETPIWMGSDLRQEATYLTRGVLDSDFNKLLYYVLRIIGTCGLWTFWINSKPTETFCGLKSLAVRCSAQPLKPPPLSVGKQEHRGPRWGL